MRLFPALLVVLLASPALADVRTVIFDTADGMSIMADWRPAERRGAPAVIAIRNDSGEDRSVWTRMLEQSGSYWDGIHFLAVDLRGHGGSRIQKGEDRAMHLDVLAARRCLVRHGADPDRVALLAAGSGCVAAARAAAAEPKIRGAVFLSPDRDCLPWLKGWAGRPLRVFRGRDEEGIEELAVRTRVVDYDDIRGTRMFCRAKCIEWTVTDWFRRNLGGRVALDGKLTKEEEKEPNTTDWSFTVGPHRLDLKSRGVYLHAILTPKAGTRPERFRLAWGTVTRARGVELARKDGTVSIRHCVLRDGSWEVLDYEPRPAAARVGGAWDEVGELLIPMTEKPLEHPVGQLTHYAVATSGKAEGPFYLLSWVKVRRW